MRQDQRFPAHFELISYGTRTTAWQPFCECWAKTATSEGSDVAAGIQSAAGGNRPCTCEKECRAEIGEKTTEAEENCLPSDFKFELAELYSRRIGFVPAPPKRKAKN